MGFFAADLEAEEVIGPLEKRVKKLEDHDEGTKAQLCKLTMDAEGHEADLGRIEPSVIKVIERIEKLEDRLKNLERWCADDERLEEINEKKTTLQNSYYQFINKNKKLLKELGFIV